MFELIIKYADGSIYWTENFPSLKKLHEWLEEERTRSYWKSEFTTHITDNSPKSPSAEEISATSIKANRIVILTTRIKELSEKDDMTPEEVKEALMKLLKLANILGAF